MVLAAEQAGLSAIAVTDHNTLKGAREVQRAARGHELLVVTGVEVSSFNGHILALGVSEPLPRGLSADETIRRINEQGGLAIASHPGRFYTGLSIHEVRASSFQAVEVSNGHSTQRQNRTALRLAKDMGAAMTGGSDAHWPEDIGMCRTVFSVAPTSEDELLEAIRDHRTEAVGVGMSAVEQSKLNASMVGRWMRRGGRRI